MKDEFIVKGAMASCQFGVAPAMINVMDNSKVYNMLNHDICKL